VLADVFSGEAPANEKRMAKTMSFKTFLERSYKPWLESNLKSGSTCYERLDKAFKDFHALRLDEVTPWLVEKWKVKRQRLSFLTTKTIVMLGNPLVNLKLLYKLELAPLTK
jgi:hypothetical protein